MSTFTYAGRQKGIARPQAHRSWVSMMQRCYNAKVERYPSYGGRGIKVCDEWHDFARFFRDMGERPAGHWLDRVNPDWHYCPENCRWSTPIEQARNKSNTVFIVIQGVRKTMGEWAESAGLTYLALYKRLKRGTPEDRLLAPPGTRQSRKGIPHSARHAANIAAALRRHHENKRLACKS